MTLSTVAVTCALLFGAGTPPGASAAPATLPRSSIAAVLAHRGELGLTDAEVSELERRDEALQKQIEEIHEQFPAASRAGGASRPTGPRSSPSTDGTAPASSPTAAALPEGSSGGEHRGGGWGGGRHAGGRGSAAARDPSARGASLQSRLDDADTTAWLSAESVLAESRREKARDVAEKYREALADEREAKRTVRP
jgi:hypothetical protein